MSERLCYIRRTDRGIVLRGLRLVGGHTDDSWTVDPRGDTDLVIETIDEAAEWIKQRIDSTSKGELTGLGHPSYGSRIRELIGEPLIPANLELLRRWRECGRDDKRLETALIASVNGISRGLQTSG